MTAKAASKKADKKATAKKATAEKAPKVKAAEKKVETTKTTKPMPSVSAKAPSDKKAVVAKETVKPVEKTAQKAAPKVELKPVQQEAPKTVAPKAEIKKPAPIAQAKPASEPKTLKSLGSGKGSPVAHGVGRRKAAVARAWLRRGGNGTLTVNARPVAEYFSTEVARKLAQAAFSVVPAIAQRYNYDVNVVGGGVHGQADAVKLAISRALVKADETARPTLKTEGLLMVDARRVERKKFGRKKARRRFQFVKR